MKIIDVKVLMLTYRLRKPLVGGRGRFDRREGVLIRITTDAGLVGIGEANAWGNMVSVATIIESNLRPLILGENPADIERLWEKMYRGSRGYGRKGASIIAISGIDIALWDILGKVLNVPLFQLLGGSVHDNLKCYASLPPYGGDPTKEVVRCIEDGYKAVKIKAWYPNELKYIEKVRDAIGSNIDLLVDANCFYDKKTAYAAADECEKNDIFWLEEPFSPDNLDDMCELTSSVNVQIAVRDVDRSLYRGNIQTSILQSQLITVPLTEV